MGLAASQGRMFLLTAQKSDLEFRGQQINNRKMILSAQTLEMAKKYTFGLSNTTIESEIISGQFKPIEPTDFMNFFKTKGWYIVDSNDIKVSDEELGELQGDQFRTFLMGGVLHIATLNELKQQVRVDWRTNPIFRQVLDTKDDEMETAKYEGENTRLQQLDKELDLELKNIDSEHKECETEIEAVKKVMDKNIESLYKTFA